MLMKSLGKIAGIVVNQRASSTSKTLFLAIRALLAL